MSEVNYVIVAENSHYMLIKDIGPWHEYKTVTNGVEIVLAELGQRLGSRLLYYIDSEGQTDQIVHDRGFFLSFKSGGPPAHNPDW